MSIQRKISQRQIEINEVQKRLFSFYREPLTRLITYLYLEQNYSLEKISEIIGISKQAIKSNYLDKNEEAK